MSVNVAPGPHEPSNSQPSKKNSSIEATKRKKEAAVFKPEHSKRRKIDDKDEHDSKVITINRAPVLELWASCVAQVLHSSLSWNTCLSIGAAISAITAISKGRSIGAMGKPDPGEAQAKKEERKEKAEKDGLDEVKVMSFRLNIDQDGRALVGGKPKKADEETLKKKYGGSREYEDAKTAFQEALEGWKGKEEELDKKAFGFYGDFRPSIPAGQKGWARKGELRLEVVRCVVNPD